MFSTEQVRALEAPLDKRHVRQRKQGGRMLDYIEGWHAIAEANRIFGFGGWSSETVETKLVAEHERSIGQSGDSGWGVTYIAKVRIRVCDIVREGCGTGHGIDRDLGQAHESALKEAETDARKRALMTFGNPFGLALYDKEQRNVTDENGHGRPDPKEMADKIIKQIRDSKSVDDLDALRRQGEFVNVFAGLPDAEQKRVMDAGGRRRRELETPTLMAG